MRSRCGFPSSKLEIWGHAHRDYFSMAPLRDPAPRRAPWPCRAGAWPLRAGAPIPAQRLAPSWLISDEHIAATGADYVALGHWNRATRVGNGSIEAHYSGSPDLAATGNGVRLTAAGRVIVSREKLLAGNRVPLRRHCERSEAISLKQRRNAGERLLRRIRSSQ